MLIAAKLVIRSSSNLITAISFVRFTCENDFDGLILVLFLQWRLPLPVELQPGRSLCPRPRRHARQRDRVQAEGLGHLRQVTAS